MKTLDEVIHALEVCTSGYCSNHDGDCPYLGQYECNEEQRNLDALFYLKEYRWVQENCADALAEKYPSENVPLTWDELKQMEGKPVWVEGEHGFIWDHKAWSLIRLDPENDDIVICISTDGGLHYEFAIGQEDYGTDWQAFRKERK